MPIVVDETKCDLIASPGKVNGGSCRLEDVPELDGLFMVAAVAGVRVNTMRSRHKE